MLNKEKILQIVLVAMLLIIVLLGGVLFYKNTQTQEAVAISGTQNGIAPEPIAVVGSGSGEVVDPASSLEEIAKTAQGESETDYLEILFYILIISAILMSRKKITKFVNDIFEKSA
jgi:hypothetical protein